MFIPSRTAKASKNEGTVSYENVDYIQEEDVSISEEGGGNEDERRRVLRRLRRRIYWHAILKMKRFWIGLVSFN